MDSETFIRALQALSKRRSGDSDTHVPDDVSAVADDIQERLRPIFSHADNVRDMQAPPNRWSDD